MSNQEQGSRNYDLYPAGVLEAAVEKMGSLESLRKSKRRHERDETKIAGFVSLAAFLTGKP